MQKNKLSQEKLTNLDPRSYMTDVMQSPAYAQERSRTAHETNQQQRRLNIIGAAAVGARSAAETYPSFSFRSNMLKTISGLHDFYQSQTYLDQHSNSPAHRRTDKYHEAKRKIINFNHNLRETIEAGANEDVKFSELLSLMSQQYAALTGTRDVKQFNEYARSAIVGMRNELATEMIMINNGVEFDQGAEEDDAHGGDFIVNGVLLDVKASQNTAWSSQEKAEAKGYDASNIIWSGIKFEDFGDNLMLTAEAEAKAAPRLLNSIDYACGTNYSKSLAA